MVATELPLWPKALTRDGRTAEPAGEENAATEGESEPMTLGAVGPGALDGDGLPSVVAVVGSPPWIQLPETGAGEYSTGFRPGVEP